MADHRTISKRKDAFYSWLRALPAPERHLAILAARGETAAVQVPPGFAADPVIKAFAALALVQFRYYTRYEQGQKYLSQGLRGLRASCGNDPRALRFLKDAENVAGNFQARHFKSLKAYRHYVAALEGERAPERRALVTVNLAKLLVTQGRLREALEALDRVALARLLPGAAREALRLQRARILLMLGAAPEAEEVVRETRGQSVEHKTNELERRYLGLMMRLAQGHDQKRIADFLDWTRSNYDAPVAAFYDLECMVLSLATSARGATKAARLRARALAKSSGAKDTLALYEALAKVRAPRASERARADLAETLRQTAGGDGQLLFQLVTLAVAKRAVDANRSALAAPFLALFDEHRATLAAGLPRRIVQRLAARPSPLVAWRDTLQDAAETAVTRLERALFAPGPSRRVR